VRSERIDKRGEKCGGDVPTMALPEVAALYAVRANKLGEASDLNRQDAKIAKPERSRPGDVPSLAFNP